MPSVVDRITKPRVALTLPFTAILDANPGISTVDKLTDADTGVDVTSTELLVVPTKLFTFSLDATPGTTVTYLAIVDMTETWPTATATPMTPPHSSKTKRSSKTKGKTLPVPIEMAPRRA